MASVALAAGILAVQSEIRLARIEDRLMRRNLALALLLPIMGGQ
jgi:hypothetical protein